jgi:hypothetical protein
VVAGRVRSSRRGIVLVDVIVGSVMLGVVLVVMIGLTTTALSAQEEGERLQTVAALLDEQLSLVLMRGPDQYESRFGTAGPCDAPFQAYRYALDFKGGTSGDPYTVRATVLWTERGRERSESIETLIAPRLGDDPDPDRKPGRPVERYP